MKLFDKTPQKKKLFDGKETKVDTLCVTAQEVSCMTPLAVMQDCLLQINCVMKPLPLSLVQSCRKDPDWALVHE
jgi:hypothetical protein